MTDSDGPRPEAPRRNLVTVRRYDQFGNEIPPSEWAGSLPPLQGPSLVPGLTLRDWFAGQALAGMGVGFNQQYNLRCEVQLAVRARHAYEIADAMLKAREAGDADH